jgi:NADH dehydrogenase
VICVLGGTGFVGRHLVNRLARLGYRVRVLTRRRARHRALQVNPEVSLIEADIHSAGALQRQFDGVAAVINLVGILNESGHGDNRFRSVHAELPARIASSASACGVARLLHMSALNAATTEPHSRYLQSKGAGEDAAHAAAAAGLAVTSFRPSVIFGPGDSFFNRFADLLRHTPLLFPLACPGSRFAPVYVGDVVAAFCRSLEDDASTGQHLELCGPQCYTLRELVEYTRDTLGLRRAILGLGDTASRLQARVLGLLPGRPFTLDNYYSLQHDSICSDNALSRLGIRPTPLQAVVPAYLARRTARGRYDRYRQAARR